MTQGKFTRTADLLEQFHNFDDAVVRSVRLVIGTMRGETTATIALEARALDWGRSDPEEGWRKVVLKVEDVTEYRLIENSLESHYVLSLGLKFSIFEESQFFDFKPYTDEPDGVEDFRRSHFYVAGRACSWEVKPYPKSWLRKTQEARNGRD